MTAFNEAPADILSGGNGWDTAALLRYAAILERLGRVSPLRDAADECARDEDGQPSPDLARWGYLLACECVRRWGDLQPGAIPDAQAFERAADALERAA